MDPLIPAQVFSLLLGLCLGSFLNVCIARLPEGESLVFPGSHCPTCGTAIRFYDNIPLVSFALLRGRCRSCGARISWRYPLVELLMGILSLLLCIKFGFGYQYLMGLVFLGALTAITFIDAAHQIIPDLISLPGIVAGLLAALLTPQGSFQDALIGVIAGGGSFYLVALVFERLTGRPGLGGGDIKMLAMIGAWLGWQALPLTVLAASLSGALFGTACIFRSGKGLRLKIPFGPFLAFGSALYLFQGEALTRWYVALLR